MTTGCITYLGGTGSPCSNCPHPVPEKRSTGRTLKGVEQVEQDKSLLGILREYRFLCLIYLKNAFILFQLFQGGSPSRSVAVFWNRVPCSDPVPPRLVEVMA